MKLVLLILLSLPIRLGSSVKPDLKILEREQRDGYECQLIEYNIEKEERVQAYLLVPDKIEKGGKCPGLVLLHDHGARFDIGKEKLVKPVPSAPANIRLSSEEWVGSGFEGLYFGDELAKQGFVVIVPDMLYWGSRSTPECQQWSRVKFCGEQGDIKALKEIVYEGQRAVYDSLAAKDVIWAEKTIREDAAAAHLLKGLKYVDKKNIGVFGWSMGAHRAWLLAAFCKDIKAGVALCWMTLKETCANPPKASDYSMMIPRMRSAYDFPDIALWLAPKPFFFLNGDSDKLFPVPQTREAFDRMQMIYSKKNATGNLRAEFFHGSHYCGVEEQKTIADYLKSVLGN